MSKIGRRRWLIGAAATAAAAFDPGRRAWAAQGGPGAAAPPPLDGQLLLDPASLAAAADDFGHIVQRTPAAVLVPGSVDDIAAMVRFARAHRIGIAAAQGIGASHSTFGQSQVDAGIVIDMSALAEIHEINAEDAWVDAGVQLLDLVQATAALGLSPPTLTDYLGLSVGGVLSAGGIGGQAGHHGLMVDNVLELEVVTGRGDVVLCSPCHEAELFDAVRSGLGQCGVITKARMRLAPVPGSVRVYTALYASLGDFLADQEMLIDDGRFDYVEGFAVHGAASGPGGYGFQLEAAKYFAPGSPPDDAALLSGLAFLPGTEAAVDQGYLEFADRLAPLVAFLQAVGAWGLPHPWIDMFVPGPAAESFIAWALSQTPPESMGQGPILIYPFQRAKLTAPLLRVPDSERVFLFSLLRTAVPPTPEQVSALLAANRALYDELMEIGGRRYPIGSVELTRQDWRRHFHPRWGELARAKAHFDPLHVMTPGQGIFR